MPIGYVFVLIFCMVHVVVPPRAYAGTPIILDLLVTDVTPRSFSVTWYTSEPCFPYLRVFDDAAGTVRTSYAIVIPQYTNAVMRPASTGHNVLQVKVAGLRPESAYYFQTETTSISTGDTVIEPNEPIQVWTGYRMFLSQRLNAPPASVPFAAVQHPQALTAQSVLTSSRLVGDRLLLATYYAKP